MGKQYMCGRSPPSNIDLLTPTLEKMAELGILLLIHGEVTGKHVDIFDREAEFIETKLKPLYESSNLKIVLSTARQNRQ